MIFERGLNVCSKRRRIGGEKRKKEKNKRWNESVLRLETRQPFEPCEPVMIHRTRQSDRGPDGSMLFSHGTVLHLKRTVKLNGS